MSWFLYSMAVNPQCQVKFMLTFWLYVLCVATCLMHRKRYGKNFRIHLEIQTEIAFKQIFRIWNILNAASKKHYESIPLCLHLKDWFLRMFRLVKDSPGLALIFSLRPFPNFMNIFFLISSSRWIFDSCRMYLRNPNVSYPSKPRNLPGSISFQAWKISTWWGNRSASLRLLPVQRWATQLYRYLILFLIILL